ncbi:tripartite motif-containing protein 29-like [Osmerus mordax]|uniref:tripartite motif-containing protein 29-like n=1 Tax=Osmerus mordax TaxID=8014 RepID=UPI00350F10D3
MAAQFKKSFHVKDTGSEQRPVKPGEVPCDVCTGTKLKALKSCLVCLISYCETHLEPHHRLAALKKHKLINPVENLDERMCTKHDKVLEMFCKSDQTCICILCLTTDHMTHKTVPVDEEYGEKMAQLGRMMARVQQMVDERSRKVKEIKHSVDLSKKQTEKVISDSADVFTSLVRSIEKNQADLTALIEKKQKAHEMRAERLIQDLQQEIAELNERSIDLEQLSHTEDHLHLLQSFPSLSSPPHTKDWSEIRVHMKAKTFK